MTSVLFLIASFCGGSGAVCRFVADVCIKSALSEYAISESAPSKRILLKRILSKFSFVKRDLSDLFVLSSMLINCAAGFLTGCLIALFSAQIISVGLETVALTGFCGGFSTFSTAVSDLAQLLREKYFKRFFCFLALALILPILFGFMGLQAVSSLISLF